MIRYIILYYIILFPFRAKTSLFSSLKHLTTLDLKRILPIVKRGQ